MGRKKRELRLKVYGQRRKEPDVRRMARAIVRLAVGMDNDQAQLLADTLEHEEALRRKARIRDRSAQRAANQQDEVAADPRKESA